MKYIDQVAIANKKVLVRVDYNISFSNEHHVANDIRITSTLPTIKHLLSRNNQVILVSHLGRPQNKERTLSLLPVVDVLKHYLPEATITFIPDFLALIEQHIPLPQDKNVILLENIRFFEGEEENSQTFSKQLSSLGDIYVNDAFSVSHRKASSTVGVTHFLPSYGGLQLKKEVQALTNVLTKPQKPLVSVLGGAKVSTKIHLLEKLIAFSDTILLGGGLANTFLAALGENVGKSFYEKDKLSEAKRILDLAEKKQTSVILPTDVVVGNKHGKHIEHTAISNLRHNDIILDIGEETISTFTKAISRAKTVIWNGPMGFFETPAYRHGTDMIYESIVHHTGLVSIVGGGDTLAALTHKKQLSHITHISTGGGAMLEFIEKGTLPGIVALENTV